MRYPLAVAGVGASAGGVEALQTLFRSADPGAGLAYIVLLHLDPDRESALTEILDRNCRLQVETATPGAMLEADHVYVVPPGVLPGVVGGRLVLTTDSGPARERHPIDVLFISLAQDLGDRAIGVVLSGFGSDGTLGIKSIDEHGGLTVAQGTEGTVPAHHGMPNSAIAAGQVNLVLPVEAIPAKLAEYARSFATLAVLAKAPAERAGDEAVRITTARRRICDSLKRQLGHDFSGHKERSFLRRVQRRMQVRRIDTLEDYVSMLEADAGEAYALLADLLIGVTAFFRDPEVFTALAEQVIPGLFEGKGAEDTVRAWVPACATGEEVYSIAILLRAHALTLPAPPRIQVFATDIDTAALQLARAGRYLDTQRDQIPQPLLERFFLRDGSALVVAKEIRDLCAFSNHSVIRDPPFSRLDLICCRNLLIYLDGPMQRALFPIFHFALQPGGALALGSSESAGQFADLFRPLDGDQRLRIYLRRDRPGAVPLLPWTLRQAARLPPPLPRGQGRSVRQVAESIMLNCFTPAHVVVNQEADIVHYSAHTGSYLEPAAGQPTRNLLALARRGLRLDLRIALQAAVEGRLTVSRISPNPDRSGIAHPIRLTVEPLPETALAEPLFLVVFDPGTSAEGAAATPSPQRDGTGAVVAAEHELQETRERLQTLIEEHETNVEELRTSNEELVSVNEELQSANEELETSKEEQQSVNEELQSLNHELRANLAQLDRANADLRNLFESTRVATIILDCDLAIRGFTPAIDGIFHLLPSDHGRPLTDIVGAIDTEALLHDARSVLAGGAPVERRMSKRDGRTHYLLRVQPYHALDGTLDGVLAAFVDVTQLVEAVEAREHQRVLVAELNHRVRNMLQVVIGLSRQTLREGQSPTEFAQTLIGRMRSLSQAYRLISRVEWGDVELRELVLEQLVPHLPQSDRGSASGPVVTLSPAAAVALGLVLHELATNAVKYGALAREGGMVTVTWEVSKTAAGREVALHWREAGGKAGGDLAPAGGGFGSELVARQVRHALRGSIGTSLVDNNFAAMLRLPLDGEPRMLSANAGVHG